MYPQSWPSVREGIPEKNTLSFVHFPNYLSHPLHAIGATFSVSKRYQNKESSKSIWAGYSPPALHANSGNFFTFKRCQNQFVQGTPSIWAMSKRMGVFFWVSFLSLAYATPSPKVRRPNLFIISFAEKNKVRQKYQNFTRGEPYELGPRPLWPLQNYKS